MFSMKSSLLCSNRETSFPMQWCRPPFQHPEIKSLGPDGERCKAHRRGLLRRMMIALTFRRCHHDLRLHLIATTYTSAESSQQCNQTAHFFLGLLQFRVFRFGSDEDGNIWVSVFPERKKILICSAALPGHTVRILSPEPAVVNQSLLGSRSQHCYAIRCPRADAQPSAACRKVTKRLTKGVKDHRRKNYVRDSVCDNGQLLK